MNGDKLLSRANITTGIQFGRAEVLRSFRNFLSRGKPGHNSTDRLEELFVGWLVNVPATCECTSGTDLLRQFYVLPH